MFLNSLISPILAGITRLSETLQRTQPTFLPVYFYLIQRRSNMAYQLYYERLSRTVFQPAIATLIAKASAIHLTLDLGLCWRI